MTAWYRSREQRARTLERLAAQRESAAEELGTLAAWMAERGALVGENKLLGASRQQRVMAMKLRCYAGLLRAAAWTDVGRRVT